MTDDTFAKSEWRHMSCNSFRRCDVTYWVLKFILTINCSKISNFGCLLYLTPSWDKFWINQSNIHCKAKLSLQLTMFHKIIDNWLLKKIGIWQCNKKEFGPPTMNFLIKSVSFYTSKSKFNGHEAFCTLGIVTRSVFKEYQLHGAP